MHAMVSYRTDTSALYGLVDANLTDVLAVIQHAVAECLEARSFEDIRPAPYPRIKPLNISSGVQVFKPIAILLLESGFPLTVSGTNG